MKLTETDVGGCDMGRAVVYCAVCGGPLEDINISPDVYGEYDENVLPKVQTKVCLFLSWKSYRQGEWLTSTEHSG